MDQEEVPSDGSTSSAPTSNENVEVESQPDSQGLLIAPGAAEIDEGGYKIPEVTTGGPVNCAQKEVQKSGRLLFFALEEDGYYSSEPEAEETEWGTDDEGKSASSESSLESEGSRDSYERTIDGQDTRNEEERRNAQVKEIRLWLDDRADDLSNMLKILCSTGGYSPELSKPHMFDLNTLESLLKLATKYNHAHLREYAIKHLDELSPTDIERFRLARDHDIIEWQATVMDQLCTRGQPITKEEASVLGFEVFSDIAARREQIQYERGKHDGLSQAL